MDLREALDRLESIEGCLFTTLQEVRSIKAALQQVVSQNQALDSLLDAEQVARILGVDPTYVYAQARAGKIPSTKVGKYRRFSPLHLKKWLDRNS